MKKNNVEFLTDAQLCAEISRCEFCEEKPCQAACPVDCSPADFIMAAKVGGKADWQRSAAIIMGSNPLGGICGAVCPDYHCMKACSHRTFDHPIDIPMVQASVVQKAKDLGGIPAFLQAKPNGKKIAVIGGGPAGLGAAVVLAQKGYAVVIFEKSKQLGGMCNLIPDVRLNKKVLATDIEFAMRLGNIKVEYGNTVTDARSLLQEGFQAVIVCTGLDKPYTLGIKGEELTIPWDKYLAEQNAIAVKGKKVAIIGGGAVAVDCALVAKTHGAEWVELICLEKLDEMNLTAHERQSILEHAIAVTGRTKVREIVHDGGKVQALNTLHVSLPAGKKFHPREMVDDKETSAARREFDVVIVAIGSKSGVKPDTTPNVFFAGDMVNGPTTVVEAVAAGKNAAAEVLAALGGDKKPEIAKKTKSHVVLAGKNLLPVSLEADFFGRKILSPFLLSASPVSDGYEQMKKAYDAGWAGGVMKTAFDNVPIHIPGEYMFVLSPSTYGNCDNVSGHPLDRVCKEIERLIKEYPDRLTMASTGGPVTGNDEADRQGWQSNTRKLEKSGVMGIEYSLSCPQGGDGTKGDIVSQDAELTAKIVDWVMQVSDPNVPKLFKLTAAVTAIYPIMDAIRQVFAKYPNKKAGVTLANSFPCMAFRKGEKKTWEEGVVLGMSGEGVITISNLTLAKVSNMGVTVSGNGGPMDYKTAADFLALGAKSVQFCTIVTKLGYGIVHDLHCGLSFLMQERGYKSVKELIGCALPNPVTGFMELSPKKKVSQVVKDLCQHCGNCTRCPYLAISLDKDKVPVTDASRCIGCSVCAQKCFAGALYMRDRTQAELAMLKEH